MGKEFSQRLAEDQIKILRQSIADLKKERDALAEALYGEYCKCGAKNATIDPNTHTIGCNYRIVMKRIERQATRKKIDANLPD